MYSDQSAHILLCRIPVDMRKSVDGLSLLVKEFDESPTSGSLYVFCNKGRNKVKILYFDRNGFCLWYKRLEKERFRLTSADESGLIHIDQQQLRWLLDGLDYTKIQGHKAVKYSAFYWGKKDGKNAKKIKHFQGFWGIMAYD